jgi:2'-5' RNA ligase
MALCPNGADRISLFALVVYIPMPLASFLDDLRKELVPGCTPRAHVTILPPRPLEADLTQALTYARATVGGFAPFEIQAGEIEIFPATDVIYLNVQEGERELREMYHALNHGPLAFREPFPYHPHITLAQDLAPEQVKPLYDLAQRRWAGCKYSRRIHADRTCFVQSRDACTWEDLAEIKLAGVPVG